MFNVLTCSPIFLPNEIHYLTVMSRGNAAGKEAMDAAEEDSADRESPAKRLLKRDSLCFATPLHGSVHSSQAISTKIDQIWNAFVCPSSSLHIKVPVLTSLERS